MRGAIPPQGQLYLLLLPCAPNVFFAILQTPPRLCFLLTQMHKFDPDCYDMCFFITVNIQCHI